MSDIIREAGRRLRNWGKWGADDERGTLNYIAPSDIVKAAGLVRRGAVFSLAIPFDAKGPQINQPRRFNPIHRMMITGPDCTTGAIRFPGSVGFSDDMVIMPLQCATQWDALSHCFEDGRMYNGYDANEVSSRGAKRNGIDKVARGVVARGVLVDMPRAKGLPWLEPGYAITAGDLDTALVAQGIAVRRGDALLVRTGHMTLCRERGGWGDYQVTAAAGAFYDAGSPAVTGMHCPEILRARSLQRNAASDAMSSAVDMRRRGDRSRKDCLRVSGSAPRISAWPLMTRSIRSPATAPGKMALTVMLCRPSSTARP